MLRTKIGSILFGGRRLSHAILLFHRRPRRRSRSIANNEMVHVLFRNAVDVDVVPVPREDVSDISGVSLLSTAEGVWG